MTSRSLISVFVCGLVFSFLACDTPQAPDPPAPKTAEPKAAESQLLIPRVDVELKELLLGEEKRTKEFVKVVLENHVILLSKKIGSGGRRMLSKRPSTANQVLPKLVTRT